MQRFRTDLRIRGFGPPAADSVVLGRPARASLARLPAAPLPYSISALDGRLGCRLADWHLNYCSPANGLLSPAPAGLRPSEVRGRAIARLSRTLVGEHNRRSSGRADYGGERQVPRRYAQGSGQRAVPAKLAIGRPITTEAGGRPAESHLTTRTELFRGGLVEGHGGFVDGDAVEFASLGRRDDAVTYLFEHLLGRSLVRVAVATTSAGLLDV